MIAHPNSIETIRCAAIWYNDGKHYVHQPTEHGIVACGHRHSGILIQLLVLLGPLNHRSNLRNALYTQGFLTSANRFVSREEALTIAACAQQVTTGDTSHATKLFSEDLY